MSTDAEIDPDPAVFWVDDVKCKAQASYKVKVGLNLERGERFLANMAVNEDREAAVRRHTKFERVKALARAAGKFVAPGFFAQSNLLICFSTPACIHSYTHYASTLVIVR